MLVKGFFEFYKGALGIFEGLAEGFEGPFETLLRIVSHQLANIYLFVTL